MVDYRMGLTVAPPQGNALDAFQAGREQRRQADARNALATIVQGQMPGQMQGQMPGVISGYGGGTFDMGGRQVTPRDQDRDPSAEAWGVLAKSDPMAALQLQGQLGRQRAQQQEQRRGDLPIIGRLLDHARDEGSYQQARAAAAQYGIDVSQLPPNFDPAWVEQQKSVVRVLSDPAKAEALSTAGKQAVDMGYRPGTPEFNAIVRDIFTASEAKPYVVGGETRLYQPKIGGQGQAIGGPAPGTVEEGYRFKGGNPADPGSWEPVGQGGGGQRVTSNFLDGL